MWKILFYSDRRGKCPPVEFINSLSFSEQAKVRNALRLLKEFGTNLNLPHARHIQDKLWELRPGGIRLFYFAFVEERFIILHGYRKKSMAAPKKEIDTALRRLKELEEGKTNESKENDQF